MEHGVGKPPKENNMLKQYDLRERSPKKRRYKIQYIVQGLILNASVGHIGYLSHFPCTAKNLKVR